MGGRTSQGTVCVWATPCVVARSAASAAVHAARRCWGVCEAKGCAVLLPVLARRVAGVAGVGVGVGGVADAAPGVPQSHGLTHIEQMVPPAVAAVEWCGVWCGGWRVEGGVRYLMRGGHGVEGAVQGPVAEVCDRVVRLLLCAGVLHLVPQGTELLGEGVHLGAWGGECVQVVQLLGMAAAV